MWKRLRRLLEAGLAAACLAGPLAAQPAEPSRGVTPDDITRLASFGRASISPDGRWAVYEKRGAYDSMPRIDFTWRSTWTIMDLWVVDLQAPTDPPQRLLPEEGLGLQRVAFSPSGDRLLVSRFRDGMFEYGVVAMADRSVRWTGLTPEVLRSGASAEWANQDAVLLLVRSDGTLPATLRYDGASQPLIAAAWARTAAGREASRTVIDVSGGVATTEARPPTQFLVALNPTTGERRILAEGTISDFALSPAGGTVAVLNGEAAIPLSDGELLQLEGDVRQRISFIDLQTGRIRRPLDDRDVAPHLLRWSADSGRVLLWARRDSQPWSAGGLLAVGPSGAVEIDMEGLNAGTSAEIVAGVKADWIGTTPILYARQTGGGRSDWYRLGEPGLPLALTGDLAVAPSRISAAFGDSLGVFADGAFRTMTTQGLPAPTCDLLPLREVVIGDLQLVRRLSSNEAPRRDWAAAVAPDGAVLTLGPGPGCNVQRVGHGDPADRIIAVAPGVVLALHRTGLSEALQLRTDAGSQRLDAVNEDLDGVGLSEPVAVIHDDAEGRPTRSWLFLPPTGTPVRGLVVKIYPGTTDSLVWWDPLTLTYGIRSQVIAGAGYAVLSPALPADRDVSTRGDLYVRSIDLAVDAALAAHPSLPSDRIAILGHSFGGYAALEVATRSSRYRSYIAASLYSDLLGVWGELDPATRILPEDGGMYRVNQGWTEKGQGALGAPPWEIPDDYGKASPYLRADRIKAPVLLLTADMDFAPMTQAERMFSALLRTGGRARLVTYWGESHSLWSPANIRDRYREIFDWLEATLEDPVLNGPAPDGRPTPASSSRTPQ